MDNVPHRLPVDCPLDRVTMELLHIPGPVNLEVRTEFEKAEVRDQESAAMNREQGQRAFVVSQVLSEEREPVGIAAR